MESPPNIVCIVLDTVRADYVSAYGHDRETTPAFDSFAASATRFTDAVAQAPWSIPSHGSLFTGTYPEQHGATTVSPVLTDGPTLPERLSAAGYETYAVSPNPYVRPATGFGRGFDIFETLGGPTEPAQTAALLDPLLEWIATTPAVRRPIEQTLNAVRKWNGTSTTTAPPPGDGLIERIDQLLERATDPFFLFVNLFDAHLPRSPVPEYEDRFLDDQLRDVAVPTAERAHTYTDGRLDSRVTRKLQQLYEADLRTMDDRLGEILSLLDQAGVFEDSLIGICSDHGEHLGEFDLVGHQHSVFEETTAVPLAVQFPEGGPDQVDSQVELRRLFQTILDEAGIESFPEQSLASGIGDETARGRFYTPGIDLGSLYWRGEIEPDGALLGEAVSFARTSERKHLEFAGEHWLFDLPESDTDAISLQTVPERDNEPADISAD